MRYIDLILCQIVMYLRQIRCSWSDKDKPWVHIVAAVAFVCGVSLALLPVTVLGVTIR